MIRSAALFSIGRFFEGKAFLCEGVLARVEHAFRLVEGDVGDAEVLEDGEDRFAEVAEGDGAVMREVLLDEDVAVEAAHLRNGEDADAAEGVRGCWQDFALGDVGAQLAIGRALEAEEGDVAVGDVALEGAARDVRRVAVLEQAVLDQLVLHAAFAELAERGVAAVEAHEGILERVVFRALDVCLEEVFRHGVVDVEQRDGILRDAEADVLGEGAVDVDFAGDGDAARDEAAVDVARLEAEFRREGWPALVGKGDVLARTFVLFHPVHERELILGHARQQVRVRVAAIGAELCRHVGDDVLDAWVVLMGAVSDEQVELGVLLDLDAEVVERLDRGVAGEEVLRTRAERDDLEVLEAEQRACNGLELGNHVGELFCRADRILGDEGLEVAQAEVVRAVEHAAVGIAAAVDEVLASLFRSGHVHDRAVELAGNQGLRRLRAEVAEEDDEGIAAGVLGFLDGGQHVLLVLDGLLHFI